MINLLHIDDEETENYFLKSNLQRISDQIRVSWAESVDEAKELLKEQQFDCILCDYQMPVTDGLQFLRELRADNGAMPFIFYTGHGDEALAIEALRAGADDYYQKELGESHYTRLGNSILSHVERHKVREERKQALEMLQASEKRFREIIESVERISIQGYNEDHNVIFWNAASEQIYGYSRSEALGRKLEEIIIPPAMRQEVESLVNRWITEGIPIPASELVLMDNEGNDVPVYSSHVMLESPAGKELYCIDVDLTATNEYKKQRNLLRRTLQSTSDFMVIGGRDGTVVQASVSLEKCIGHGVLMGMRIEEVRESLAERDTGKELLVIDTE